jgi:hypothetical protein
MRLCLHARINDSNLKPFLTSVGIAVNYQIDSADWYAIEAGVESSDIYRQEYFEYGLGDIDVRPAIDREDSELAIEIRYPRTFRARRGIDREVPRVSTGAWVHRAAACWVQDGAGRAKEGCHGRCRT